MIFKPGEELLIERFVEELKEKDLRKTPACEKYGYGAALRAYYGMPRSFPLNLKSQHGVCLWDEIPSSELSSKKKLMLVFNRRWLKKWEQARTGKWVLATPNPFLLYKKKHNIRQRSDASGSVFFYAHSTAREQAENDSANLIKTLKELPDSFGECLVSMHYVDVMRGEYKPFLDAGFKVFCAGHFSDVSFPERFYSVLSSKKYALSNSIGSHYFYAIEHGLPFSYVGAPPVYKNAGYESRVWSEIEAAHKHIYKTHRMLSGLVTSIDRCEQQRVSEELGADIITPRHVFWAMVCAAAGWHFGAPVFNRLYKAWRELVGLAGGRGR